MYPNWGFCSIRSKLIKLACWIDVFDRHFMNSTLCDDQLVIFFLNGTSGFSNFWGFFVKNSIFKPILCI